jgi:hypothetical protein
LYGSKRPRSISADIAFSVVNLKTVPCLSFRCRIGDLAESEHDRLMNAILERSYRCAGGVEARRFNRLLIEAGLIKGL